MPLTETSRVRAAGHTVARTMDETVALLDVNSGTYYTVDEAGVLFVALCGKGATLGQIADRICAEYEVSREEALADMIGLAEDLVAEGLFETVEA